MKHVLTALLIAASQSAFAGFFSDSFDIELQNILTVRKDSVTVELHAPKKQLQSKPAVIFMGGCDGSVSDGAKVVIKSLVDRGVLVAELKSLRIWGRSANACTGEKGALEGWQRAEEAYRARDELVKRGLANEENVGLVGFSHGGWAISYAVFLNSTVTYETKNFKPFKAAVAFYPWCQEDSLSHDLRTPTLMLIGAKDTWTPLDRCTRLEERAKKAGTHDQPLELVVYENASHSYDNDKPRRSAPTGKGFADLWYDKEATDDSLARTMAWFEKYMELGSDL
jgi:dienelactone hydrolase